MRQWLATSRWPRYLVVSFSLSLAFAVVIFTFGHRYQVKRSYDDAERAWERGEYRRAVELFQKVADEYPSDPLAGKASFRKGNTYLLFLRQESDAILAFRDLIERDPQGSWSHQAQKLLCEIFEERLEDYLQAIVEYQRLLNLSHSPEEASEAQLGVARCYFKLGDFSQACLEYEKHIETYPEGPFHDKALQGLANCYYVSRRYRSAITFYQRIREESADPQIKAEASFGLASCLAEAGDREEALEEFRRIVDTHPNGDLVKQRIERLQQKKEKVTP